MFTPITFPTALFFWLSYNNKKALPVLTSLPEEHMKAPFQKDLLLSVLQDYGLEPPFHIMVQRSSQRHRGAQFISHVMPKRLPPNSFIHLSDSAFIISPELCFLFAAKLLSIPDLVVLANDLCGIYARDEWAEFQQISRKPVTTAESIKLFQKKVHHIDGMRKARIAADYALDCSNSPMESKLAAAFVLRYIYGGFSFERPSLNDTVLLADAGTELMGLDHLCCDFVWRSKRLIVEYDSDLAHLSKKKFYYDKKRTSALALSNYTVISLTHDDFRNTNTIDQAFSLISDSLDNRIYKKDFDASYQVRKDLLRHFFLETNSLDWFSMFSS